jgi:hypothetical protein
MQNEALDNSTTVRWANAADEPSTTFQSRSDRDERAIRLTGYLLMAGVALERQVNALVRVRSRPRAR